MHEKGSPINILRDNEFSKSREELAAKRKNLVRQGKGNCPNSTRELTESDEDALFENGQFGVHDPKSLQRTLRWFLSLHFGWRARDESRKLCWADVGLAIDPETDSEYLVWKSERGSKTRTADKIVVIREPSNPKHTQATTSQDAQLNFTKLFEVTVPKRCLNEMLLFISPQITNKNQPTKYGISTDPSERMKLASSSKTPMLQPNLMTQTRRFLITPLERPVFDDFSKQAFSQTSLHI